MKIAIRAAVILGLVGLISSLPVKGQAKEYSNVLSTNIFNYVISTFSVEYEHFNAAKKMGVYATVRYGSFEISDIDITWPGASIGVRWYPGGHAPSGFFWGPLLYWNQMKAEFTARVVTLVPFSVTEVKEDVTASFFGPMVGIGYRWNWGGFTFAPAFQAGFLTGDLESSLTGQDITYGGGAWGLGLNAGFAF